MTVFLQLDKMARTLGAQGSPTVSTVYRASDKFNTGAGTNTIPADLQVIGGLDRSSIDGGPTIRTADEPGVDADGRPTAGLVTVSGKRKHMGIDDPDLDNAEIVGQRVKLWEVGLSEYGPTGPPIGDNYTLTDPWVYAEGIVAEGSVIRWDSYTIKIAPDPLVWHKPALNTFNSRGPTLQFPLAGSSRCTWQVYDPPGDTSIFAWVWLSLNTWEDGGTQTVFDNGSWKLEIVGARLVATIAHATADAEITSPVLPKPFAFYAVRMTYETSKKQLELWINGVSQGVEAGTGAITASGLSWTLGAAQNEASNFYRGFLGDFWIFETLFAYDDAAELEKSDLNYDETDLFVALQGQSLSIAKLIDAGPAVNKGLGLVGIPSTGHTLVAGQEITIAGTTNYDVTLTLLDPTTSVNELVITATFVAETFGGTETVSADYGTLVDETLANQGAPKNATIKACRPGPSGGGVSAGSTATDTLGGTIKDRSTGPVLHVRGRQVDEYQDLFVFGDWLWPVDINAMHQGGEPLAFTRYTSLLALYAATIPALEAGYAPCCSAAIIGTRTEGSIAADVKGESPWVRGLYFDGADDHVDFGTTDNAAFIADWSVRMIIDVPIPSSARVLLSNLESGTDGIYFEMNGSRLLVSSYHDGNIASATYLFPLPYTESLTGELLITEEFTVDDLDTDTELKLYLDGELLDTGTTTVATADLVASGVRLVLGAAYDPGSGLFLLPTEGTVSELSIFSTVLPEMWAYCKFIDDIYHHPAGGGEITDNGDGTVSIPVHYHPWSTADEITLSGFVDAAYNGDHIVNTNTTGQSLVITAAHTAETSTGLERIYARNLEHHYPGRVPNPGSAVFPASTLADEIGSLDGTITGAEWRGGVALTSPRSTVVYHSKHSLQGDVTDVGTMDRCPGIFTGQPGRLMDISSMTWPDYSIAHTTRGEPLTVADILLDIMESWDGGYWVSPEGVVTFGRILDPADLTADHTITYREVLGDFDGEESGSPARSVLVAWGAVHYPEQPGELLEGVEVIDRNVWAKPGRVVDVPVPRAEYLFPLASDEPAAQTGWWATESGARAEGQRRALILQRRRMTGKPTVKGDLRMYVHPDTGAVLKPFDIVEVTHPHLEHIATGGTAKAILWRPDRKYGAMTVGLDLRMIRIA